MIYGVGRRPNRVFVSGYHLLRSTVFRWSEFRAEWGRPRVRDRVLGPVTEVGHGVRLALSRKD